MTSNPAPFDDADLHAYADGCLPPERIGTFEAALKLDPALAARVAEIRALSAALRAALDPIVAEPIPERLIQAATGPVRGASRSRWPRWLGPAVAVAATLVLGIGVGWYGRKSVPACHSHRFSHARAKVSCTRSSARVASPVSTRA